MVLAVVEGRIQAITGFQDASLFRAFGLPQTLAEAWGRHLSPEFRSL
jgi:hypothetical protein